MNSDLTNNEAQGDFRGKATLWLCGIYLVLRFLVFSGLSWSWFDYLGAFSTIFTIGYYIYVKSGQKEERVQLQAAAVYPTIGFLGLIGGLLFSPGQMWPQGYSEPDSTSTTQSESQSYLMQLGTSCPDLLADFVNLIDAQQGSEMSKDRELLAVIRACAKRLPDPDERAKTLLIGEALRVDDIKKTSSLAEKVQIGADVAQLTTEISATAVSDELRQQARALAVLATLSDSPSASP